MMSMKMPHDRDTSDHPQVHRHWRWQWRCRHCGHVWATTHGAAPQVCAACGASHDGVQVANELVATDADGVERIIYRKPNRRGD